jgi:phosphate transport system ATP-binding protein
LNVELEVKNLSFYYTGFSEPSLKNNNFPIYKHKVTALIGPSGCGKTTLLRCFNRMHDLYPGNRYEGEILFRGRNILAPDVDLIELRTKIGMVFQKPTPFPMSIFDNVAYGLRLRGIKNKKELAERVEKALRESALWDEVKDKLKESGLSLSGGQQQRLCIARAIAVEQKIFTNPEKKLTEDYITGRFG